MASNSLVSIADFGVNLGLNDNLTPALIAVGNEIRKTESYLKSAFDEKQVIEYQQELIRLKQIWNEAGGAALQAGIQQEKAAQMAAKAAADEAAQQTKLAQAAANAAEKEIQLSNATNNLNQNSYNNFRAIGQADRITREFAAGGLTQGLNGLTMFGNSLTRLATQEGGFQNALTGLLDAFSGPAGIVLVVSAAIGIFEQLSKKESDAEKANKEFAKSIIDTNKEIKDALNLHNSQITTMKGLVAIATDYTIAENTRAKALKEIKIELESVNKEEAKKLKTTEQIIGASNAYIEALKSQQLVEVSGKKIAELTLQIEEDRNKIESTSGKGLHILDMLGLTETDIEKAQNRVIQAEGLKRRLEDINKSALVQTLNNPFSSNNKNDNEKAPPKFTENLDLQNLKEKQKYYKDDLDSYYEYGDKIIKKEGEIEEQKALKSKLGGDAIKQIQEITNQKLLNNELEFIDAYRKQNDIFDKEKLKEAEKSAKEIYESQVYFANQRIKAIEGQVNAETKLYTGNYLKQKEAIKIAMAEIGAIMVATNNPKALMDLANAFDYLNNKLNAFGGVGKKITDIIDQMMISSFTALGETIGNAFSTGSFDFSAIGDIIANGLIQIGTALIAFATMEGLAIDSLKDPALWPVALAGGVLAVAAGTVLKNSLHPSASPKKMAEGGIVSTPTFAMIGEGGQSEAVLPLNKLGNIVNNTFNAGLMSNNGGGGNNGQFTLKGNDLVLALQRSNYSLNLRRGS